MGKPTQPFPGAKVVQSLSCSERGIEDEGGDGHTFWQPADDEPEFLRVPLPASDVLEPLRDQPKLAIVHRMSLSGRCALPL